MARAKAKGHRLKVFQAQIGFYDTVVAAPSQAAALRAWGIHQNLFADGAARVTDDAQASEAALLHPELPLRRAVGSNDPFALEPASLPKIPEASKRPNPRARSKLQTEPPKRPPADRTALTAAEGAVERLDADRKKEEATFRRRQDQLDADRDAGRDFYADRRKAATAAVVGARKAYRAAGGDN